MFLTQTKPDEIINNLYLGNVLQANNPDFLDELNIKGIINASQMYYTNKIDESKIKVHVVNIKDADYAPIDDHFESCSQFIEYFRSKNENVLVHCQAGISRSSSLVIA